MKIMGLWALGENVSVGGRANGHANVIARIEN